MARHTKVIDMHILHVNRQGSGGLCRVYHKLNAVLMAQRADAPNRKAHAPDIRGMRTYDKLRIPADSIAEGIDRFVIVAGINLSLRKGNAVFSSSWSGRITELCSMSLTTTWSPLFKSPLNTMLSEWVQLSVNTTCSSFAHEKARRPLPCNHKFLWRISSIVCGRCARDLRHILLTPHPPPSKPAAASGRWWPRCPDKSRHGLPVRTAKDHNTVVL